ncbi:spore coat protein u [Mesorhizobium sp. NBSH29]|uniref:Csu type fimbrial protein n=1 Tax=Mesorhizobium sp. NBSH29 TaxID=2654249 RepID=UPI0018C03FD2|nr:spore coat protein u [Mesorhizobium sp. NBSH29]
MMRCSLSALFLTVALGWTSSASAQSCNFTVSTLSFGNVDTLSGSATNSTATISASCSGYSVLTPRVLVCPNIGAGTGGATAGARQMAGAGTLNYQLYSDASRTAVWGSYAWPYPARAPAMAVGLLLGAGSASDTIYGSVFGGQQAVPTGSYLAAFSSADVEFLYRATSSSDCTTPSGTAARPTFNVTANIPANCLVSAQNLDFGTNGVLNTNVDATGGVAVQCTQNSAYSVSLGGGNANGTPTERKMSRLLESVTYGLYKDAARSQPWGDVATPGSTVPGSGSGGTQNFTVYGRVPAQQTPSPGVYNDTVVVTVTY